MTLHRDLRGRFLPAYVNDPFDPRGWDEPLPYQTIYLAGDHDGHCIVDEIDYAWAIGWLWRAVPDKHGRKHYATRSFRLNGRKGPNTSLFLHKEILLRVGPPPTPRHCIGDHLNGHSLDNRRGNLRWATPSMNGLNRYGFAARQIAMGL